MSGIDVFKAIVREQGIGDELVLGSVPRSTATDAALGRAVDIAAQRGVLGPSSEHLVLALAAQDSGRVARILAAVGVDDVVRLVDGIPGDRRPSVSDEQLKRYLLRVAGRRSAPSRDRSHRSFSATRLRRSGRCERGLRPPRCWSITRSSRCICCWAVCQCLPAWRRKCLRPSWRPARSVIVGEAMERTRMYGSAPAHQATGIFAEATRRIVAEGALRYAYRRGDPHIGTGHLLLATLDAGESVIDRIIGSGVMGSEPVL